MIEFMLVAHTKAERNQQKALKVYITANKTTGFTCQKQVLRKTLLIQQIENLFLRLNRIDYDNPFPLAFRVNDDDVENQNKRQIDSTPKTMSDNTHIH